MIPVDMSKNGPDTCELAESPAIQISDLNHTFYRENIRVDALSRVSLTLNSGEFVAIVGPSGCGKTTLLNAVAGLVTPSSGDVAVHGRKPVVGARDVGFLFARDGLLPWRTALANVTLPLEISGVRKRARDAQARQMLQDVGLGKFEESFPAELSQGMRQRVAIARTLVMEPALLLMDEPFSALDAQTRLNLHEVFLHLWERLECTVLFITHDLNEAVTLADRVIVFSQRPGRIKLDIEVELERPRSATALQRNTKFHEIFQDIWKVLESEMRQNDAH